MGKTEKGRKNERWEVEERRPGIPKMGSRKRWRRAVTTSPGAAGKALNRTDISPYKTILRKGTGPQIRNIRAQQYGGRAEHTTVQRETDGELSVRARFWDLAQFGKR